MAHEFDPYLRWLGIRDPDRPPNHYRLLGLDPFETDSDIIAEAADRQMGHVRSHQHGPNSAVSQRLLNELARAKVCLLNHSRKAAYDNELRERLNARAPAKVVAVPVPATLPIPVLPVLPDVGSHSTPADGTPSSSASSPALRPSLCGTSSGGMPVETSPEAQQPKLVRGRPVPTMVRLTVLGGPCTGLTYEFRARGTFTVGRGRQADFSLAGDLTLSRVHFSIKLNPPCCFVKNLSETSQGTRLNGRPVQETLVQHGDIISWGQDTEIRIELVPAHEAATSSAAST